MPDLLCSKRNDKGQTSERGLTSPFRASHNARYVNELDAMAHFPAQGKRKSAATARPQVRRNSKVARASGLSQHRLQLVQEAFHVVQGVVSSGAVSSS